MDASLSLAAKCDLIKIQLGLPTTTSIPETVDVAAAQLGLTVNSLALPQQVEACCKALFSAPAPPMLPDPPSPAAIAIVDTPGSFTASAVSATMPCESAGPSAAHHVPSMAMLRQYLLELELTEMASAAEESCASEWFAEHARAQLSPDSGCESRPAWVCQTIEPHGNGARCVTLWAADEKATRRALLALQLQRGCVDLVVRGYAGASIPAQLHRWVYEHEGYELTVHEAKNSELRATVRAARDESERDAARQQRAESAEEDLAVAWAKVESLSRCLLAEDPLATMEICPSDQPGCYTMSQVTFKGHRMEFSAQINRHSSVDDLVRVATTSCLCC